MKGQNEFHFNTATMMHILQHYFNTVLLEESEKIKVKNVYEQTKSYGSVFIVVVDEYDAQD